MSIDTYFADIIVPVPVEGVFTYRIPQKFQGKVSEGSRVLVQFGRKKLYAGIVMRLHQQPPKQYQAKYIDAVLDEAPIVTTNQLKLWQWMAVYYMTPVGQVVNVALPLGLKISSETKYILNPYEEIDETLLSDDEFLIYEAIQNRGEITPQEAEEILGKTALLPAINKMIKNKILLTKEDVKNLFKPKKEKFVSFTDKITNQQSFNELYDKIGKAPAQQRGVLTLAYLVKNDFSKEILQKKWIEQAKISPSTVQQLKEKNYIKITEKEISRLRFGTKEKPINPLNDYQKEKLIEIKEKFSDKNVVLLHGVTASGKTELYIHLIKEQIDKGNQVLYLLPEIAITTQIIERLKNIFGEDLGVYHSKFSPQERVEVWQGVLSGKLKLIIGARSAIFLPFVNLGLIIVDEEHDASFKQTDLSPRYHARDLSILLATYFNAKVLLGTATPSIESYYNAQIHKYALIKLNKRYRNIQLPQILVADLKSDYKKRKMKGHFSGLLIENMKEALENNEQIILFQNRRGFSPYIQCNVCDWIAQCKNCAVKLTYHKKYHELKCHYCGYTVEMLRACQNCNSTDISLRGLGTEKIEEEISEIFPNASVKRMDADTTRSKNAYLNIINDFQDHKIDILIGTQMVTKGLDFENVQVVGIMNADNTLNFPDFRAYERSFQLFTQVAGRAGRKNKQGKVIIQTFTPYHPVIRDVLNNDYENLYKNEIIDRRNYHYPPFYRLVKLIFRHKTEQKVKYAARKTVENLRMTLNVEITGPEKPLISRIRNKYIQEAIIKLSPDKYLHTQKKMIYKEILQIKTEVKGLEIIADVDPY